MGCWSLGAYPPVPITKAKKIRRLRRDRLNSNHLNGARFAIASCTDDPWFISFNASHSEAVSPQRRFLQPVFDWGQHSIPFTCVRIRPDEVR
jgi:hypothetical protein